MKSQLTLPPARFLLILLVLLVVVLAAAGFFAYRWANRSLGRSAQVIDFIRHPEDHPEWKIEAGTRCGQAPFIFPTTGMVGYLWDDSFRPGHRHQGLDIFAGTEPNQTPVIAAYPGYLSRMEDWKSSLIIRLPSDPLNPERQIWTYYTHMADSDGNSFISADFPPGTHEVYVEAGTVLGNQGNYSGDTGNPVGVHLHFSIVLSNEAGGYLNELEIRNTLDPSPYLGLPLNANQNPDQVPLCESQP